MKSSTTIQEMLAGNKIIVPDYQRAYSWDTETDSFKSPKQVNTFLTDLEEYNRSFTKSKYYFGHFLFEEKSESEFGVIDGQQRLTTIIIFLSALFTRLSKIRPLTEKENKLKEEMVNLKLTQRFETVGYDRQFFKDYVIYQSKKDTHSLETLSAKRIAEAFDFFTYALGDKNEEYLLKMLNTIQEASCTTHPVKDESEAIQMFIFQNNRGKKPSNLEIIKAEFMFTIHLHGGEEKNDLIEDIKNRFEKIYKSISSIEYNIGEDNVLLYTLRVHFNSLDESNALDKINKELNKENPISFIKFFTQSLAFSFEHLTTFFGKDERESFEVHSLITLGGIGIAFPFVIKAYQLGIEKTELNKLCSSLESLVLRHRLIGTRADIIPRINDVFKSFKSENPEIKPIVDRIEWMKTMGHESRWWSHWNTQEFENSLQGKINASTAKFLLWKYENYLESNGKRGYSPSRFEKIIRPEVEHIAPSTENPESGYDTYDDDFRKQYINCLGNYLLISKSHNCSAGNKPFVDKRDSYNHLEQQREIQKMTEVDLKWTKEKIAERKSKIIEIILTNF